MAHVGSGARHASAEALSTADRGYVIARADLAGAILTLLDDPTSIRATIGIGY